MRRQHRRLRAFISSKMEELAAERQVVKHALEELEIDTWVFELDAGARSQSIRQTYLEELDRSDLYIGLFWKGYGEYTIDEFKHAIKTHKYCLIYEKRADITGHRDPRLQSFLDEQSKVETGLTIRWFDQTEELVEFVKQDVAGWQSDIFHRYQTLITLVERVRKLEVVIINQPGVNRQAATEFLGRRDLIDQINKYIAIPARVQVTGMGGSGKTALAAKVADDHAHARKGPIIWLETENEPANAIFDAFISNLASSDQKQAYSSLGVDAAIDPVKRLLAQYGATLLVLDNVWNGEALSTVLRAVPKDLPLIVTSRQWFPIPGLNEVTVGDLPPDEALEVLNFYADQRSFTMPEAEKLMDLLGYHTYALQIAGATLGGKLTLTPDKLSKLIADEPDAALMPGIAPIGRESVRKLLEVSYRDLTPASQETLMAFGALHTRVATPNLIAAISQMDETTTALELFELDRRKLVKEIGEDIYEMHDLTFSFARAKFAGLGVDPEAIVAIIDRYVSDHPTEYDLLKADLGNILGAASTTENEEFILRVISNLAIGGYPLPQGLSFLEARGHNLALIELLDRAITLSERRGVEMAPTTHHLLSKRGNIAFGRGDYRKAAETYQGALSPTSDQGRQVILNAVIGKALSFMGDQGEARTHFDIASNMARELQDDFLISYVLEQEAKAAGHNRDFETAQRLSQEQLAINESILETQRNPENLEAYFSSLINLGSAERELGLGEKEHLQAALTTHMHAQRIADELNIDELKAVAASALAWDYHQLGEWGQAQAHFDTACRIWLNLGMSGEYLVDARFMREHGYELPTEADLPG